MPSDDKTSPTSAEPTTSNGSLPDCTSSPTPSGSNTNDSEDEDFLTAPLVGLCTPKAVHEMSDAELIDHLSWLRQVTGSYQTFKAEVERSETERTGRKAAAKRTVTSNEIDDLLA